MILFQDVIQVRHGPVPAVFIQSACGFEPHDRRRVRAVTVGIDDARHGMVLPSQRFGQEALCGSRIKRRVNASQHFRSFWGAWRTIAGYEAIHMIRKGQACESATGTGSSLLHRFVLGIFGIDV